MPHTRYRLEPDPFRAGSLELLVDDVAQSHVDLADPTNVVYDYTSRLCTALDAVLPTGPGARPEVLHLGAGALTVARRVAVTHPHSRQLAVDVDAALLAFVAASLGVPGGVETRAADALAAVVALADEEPTRRFDAVIVDVYAGLDTPSHLTTPEFFEAVLALLRPEGALLVNVADDAGLPITRRRMRALAPARAPGLPGERAVVAVGPTSAPGTGGNVVLAVAPPAVADRLRNALLAAGPHPVADLTAAAGPSSPGRSP